MVGLSFRMFKDYRIRIRGILLGEMVLQEMGAHRIEMGMPMQVKENWSSVIIVMRLDILHGTVLSRSVHRILIISEDKMLLMQAQENGAVLDEEELLFLAGEQADECDTFDSDVDDEPTAQSIFMANLSSARSANPQACPSNTSILSEANVIHSTSVDMGNNNVIPYEKYLSVDNIFVVPSCASSALNDVCVLSHNDAFIPHDPIATELKIYKEQVAIYEQRAKFELTEREQRMDDQMRMLIQNRNKIEENLKKELHSVKLQLNSTMENNKIIEETVMTLKQASLNRKSLNS
ncbi:hypothetical protein Tco_1305247 [Tanacetum coccineum]